MEEGEIRFVGIDLAKRTLIARIESPAGKKAKIVHCKTRKEGIDELVSHLGRNDRVALEACSLAFFIAKTIKKKAGCEVYILNPGQLAVIYQSTKKTDWEDARKLTWLLSRFPPEELPTVPLPTEQEERRRLLVSERSFEKKLRTKLINRLHSIFVREGVTGLLRNDLRTDKNRKMKLDLLSERAKIEAERICAHLELLEKHISDIDHDIETELKKEPLSPYLLSVPGVGKALAVAFLAHVGDGSRFRSGKQVSHFVGITPRIDNSGETIRTGHITKRGCVSIRSLIVQSAWAAVHARIPNRFQQKYLDLADRRGKGRAIVAIARRMLELLWVLVTKQQYFNQINHNYLAAKLGRLGLRSLKYLEPGS